MPRNEIVYWPYGPGKQSFRSIGFDADENGQLRQAQHQIPIASVCFPTIFREFNVRYFCWRENKSGFASSLLRGAGALKERREYLASSLK